MNFLIFPGNDDVFYRMFDEVNDKVRFPNVNVSKDIFRKHNNDIISFRNRLSYNVILGGVLNSVFDMISSIFLKVGELEQNVNEETCFVFSNITFRLLPNYIINRLLSNRHIHIVVYMLDSSSQPLCKESIKKCLKYKIRNVYTFDLADAQKYGFYHFYYIYSKLTNRSQTATTDVMFFGSDKGRVKKILQLSKKFENKNISSKMYIVGVYEKVQESEKIIVNKPIPYAEMIKILQGTRCILDYVIEDQVGLSYRPMEAICYNKKLLTNNKSIMSFPYYNSKFMQYFENIEQIDMNFIKRDETIDYGYKGEYSPENFIQRIESDIHNGGKRNE